MKRLILMRHAKSDWAEDGLHDADRPLAARGERDAPRMGARLKKRAAKPDLVLSSHAQRAQSTAKLVIRALGQPADRLRIDEALYLAEPSEILAVVARQSDAHSTLLLVGHNPGLTDLANQLAPDLALDNLPTAGIVAVEFTATRWSELEPAGTLAYFDFPKSSED